MVPPFSELCAARPTPAGIKVGMDIHLPEPQWLSGLRKNDLFTENRLSILRVCLCTLDGFKFYNITSLTLKLSKITVFKFLSSPASHWTHTSMSVDFFFLTLSYVSVRTKLSWHVWRWQDTVAVIIWKGYVWKILNITYKVLKNQSWP